MKCTFGPISNVSDIAKLLSNPGAFIALAAANDATIVPSGFLLIETCRGSFCCYTMRKIKMIQQSDTLFNLDTKHYFQFSVEYKLTKGTGLDKTEWIIFPTMYTEITD